MTSVDIAYIDAKEKFENAKFFTDIDAKTTQLKLAYREAYGLPDDYEGKYELMSQISIYADMCGIDLDFYWIMLKYQQVVKQR